MTDINVIQRQLNIDSLDRKEQDLNRESEDEGELDNYSDLSSLGKRAYDMDRSYEDYSDELSMGSLRNDQDWASNWPEPQDPQSHLEELMGSREEEITEEDARKIERWTRIREDGYEIINGIKYTETGSIIYSDYEREDEEQEEDDEEEEDEDEDSREHQNV